VSRFFNLLEAEKLLPRLDPLLRSIAARKGEYETAEAEIKAISARITLSGGMLVSHEKVAGAKRKKEAAARSLAAAVREIQELGCLLKDADIGLIDFPTLYHGREVYLCWKLGEPEIGFWHPVEDGFRGRRPIDSEFLANHCGGSHSDA
jgi:hypothetical protein